MNKKNNINFFCLIIINILLILTILIIGKDYVIKILIKAIINFYSGKVKIIGKQNIPTQNGYIVVSNHNFICETFIIKKILNTDFFIIAKENPLIKLVCDNLNLVLYNKEENKIKESGKIIKKIILEKIINNKNVIIFPEGSISHSDYLLKFKKGLFYLCYENNIPILPIIICIKKNSKYSQKGFFLLLDKKIKIKIFKMVYPNSFKNFVTYYNYIYNIMNDFIVNYINNNKYSIFI